MHGLRTPTLSWLCFRDRPTEKHDRAFLRSVFQEGCDRGTTLYVMHTDIAAICTHQLDLRVDHMK